MKEYVQIIKGHYDDNGAVKAIDILNDKPLTADYMKTRPDIKQRVEKAINTQTYLATYQRGTRLGFKWILTKKKNNLWVKKQIILLKKKLLNTIKRGM